MLRQQTQSVKKTNGRFPEFKGSQRCHRGPRVDSEWSGKPVRFATVCAILPSDQFHAVTCSLLRTGLYSCPTEARGAEHRAQIIPDSESVTVAQEDLQSRKGSCCSCILHSHLY